MKTLEFIYQETQIHFLINPQDDNVMINATEMAKLFNKEVRSFLRLDGTKQFVKALLEKKNIIQYDSENIVFDRTHLHGQKQNFISKLLLHSVCLTFLNPLVNCI